jgi:hypothetical protein
MLAWLGPEPGFITKSAKLWVLTVIAIDHPNRCIKNLFDFFTFLHSTS